MSTITQKSIIQTLLDNDGIYPGDPQADSIFEYTQAGTGAVLWAVFYAPEQVDIHTSPFVNEYIRLWDRRCGHLAPIGILEKTGERQRTPDYVDWIIQ
jgi:hypothetical protein